MNILKGTHNKELSLISKFKEEFKKNTVFSYNISKEPNTIILVQNESGLKLSLKVENFNKLLQITEFNLICNPTLKCLSIDLDDSAHLEIIVQSLLIIFAYAN